MSVAVAKVGLGVLPPPLNPYSPTNHMPHGYLEKVLPFFATPLLSVVRSGPDHAARRRGTRE